ncbi:hypothetical protein CI102_8136 [Trichoderma harzianum]|nr:hypothetical protein CI102_8136 [Trichoderma harzianum]
MTNSPPTIKTPSSALLILSHSPVHTDTHTNLPPKLTKSCHSYSINPLPLKKSSSGPFPPQIMSLAISGYLHRQKNPPLSPSLICSTTRLESPQTGAISFRMGIAQTVPGKSPAGDQQPPMHGISI